MIKIEHPKINEIRKDYTTKVVLKIIERLKALLDISKLLYSNKAVETINVRGRVDEFNIGLKVLLDDKEINSVKTVDLVTNLNRYRNEISVHNIRITKVLEDIKHFNDNKVLYNLISSEPENLIILQKEIQKKLKLPPNDELFRYIFSYDYFYENYIKKIGADLGINVCPYCNRQYITNVQDINGKRIVGPTYDHFFSQSDNPLLTLSFYNLIPSCYTCNSNLKHKKKFDFDRHLHPYFNGMEEDAVFDFELDTSTTPLKSKIDFKPSIVVLVDKSTSIYKRLEKTDDPHSGSLNVFKLRKIYATHNDIVEEIHEKFDEKSIYYSKSIKPFLDDLKTNQDEFYRFYFGNYFDIKDFNKRPLAKLTRDIYNKMKSIYDVNKSYRTE